jgi:hypothetical protein
MRSFVPPVSTALDASPQVPSLLPRVPSLSLHVLLSFRAVLLSLLSVAGFTDNSTITPRNTGLGRRNWAFEWT